MHRSLFGSLQSDLSSSLHKGHCGNYQTIGWSDFRGHCGVTVQVIIGVTVHSHCMGLCTGHCRGDCWHDFRGRYRETVRVNAGHAVGITLGGQAGVTAGVLVGVTVWVNAGVLGCSELTSGVSKL